MLLFVTNIITVPVEAAKILYLIINFRELLCLNDRRSFSEFVPAEHDMRRLLASGLVFYNSLFVNVRRSIHNLNTRITFSSIRCSVFAGVVKALAAMSSYSSHNLFDKVSKKACEIQSC